MNRFVNFDNCEQISCSCIDCDDWDVVKVDLCEFSQPENVKKRDYAFKKLQEQNRKIDVKIKKIQEKRHRYEKMRNNKCMKNKMKQLVLYVNKMVHQDEEKKKLVNGLRADFKSDDLFCLKLLIVENNINNLIDLLNLRRLYHIKIEKCFGDQRLVPQFKPEVHTFNFTNDAIYKLRVLVGLVRFGTLDEGHFFAVFRNVKEDEVKLGIKTLFENQFIL